MTAALEEASVRISPFRERVEGERKPLSYSAARQYLSCGEQYRLERIEKKERRPSTAAAAGRIIHSATEAIDHLLFEAARNSHDVSDGDIYDAWTDAANFAYNDQMAEVAEKSPSYVNPSTWLSYGRPTQSKPRGEDIGWFIAQGIPDSIAGYVAWRREGDWDVMAMPDDSPAIEVAFEFDLPSGVPLRGVIDRVFVSVKTGQPLIVDLKSGQKPKADAQLAVYKFGLEDLMAQDARGFEHGSVASPWGGPSRFAWGAYYYGMKKGGTLTSPIDLSYWTVEMLEQIYGETDQGIAARNFTPNPGENCMHCSVAHHCRFSRSAI